MVDGETTEASPPSGLKSGGGPAISRSSPDGAIVDASDPARPEFDRLGDQREPTPMGRSRDDVVFAGRVEALCDIGEFREHFSTGSDRFALGAGPGPQPGFEGTGGEIGVAAVVGCEMGAAFDSGLASRPVEDDRAAWVGLDRAALPTLAIREHRKFARFGVDLVAEHHSDRCPSIRIGGGEGDRVRIALDTGRKGFPEPALHDRCGIFGQGISGQPGVGQVFLHRSRVTIRIQCASRS